ncbi:hypothetical protein MesoLj113a_50320 [Mesorhizobium sp. 113-1-2]|uniref:hypothetical protein n=1 Tax=Mesorhizobium sp. 113-1-2 TaxID=2744515 RepID=UPI0019255F62|nr:hypothetical protein [Mesorhizobium sp. 113-1-2]BCG73874.1 hypothetical protein MesoLj113a_50320 [Mesorhizobium sp. 113-1-2]
MRYLIDYFEAGLVAWSDISINDLALAKHMASAAVTDGLAERTEIRDQDGRLLNYYPRMLRVA